MRVLILGGGGMLGHKLWQQWSRRFDCVVTLRGRAASYIHLPFFRDARVLDRVDATDANDVTRVVAETRADVVVNCIGVIKQTAAAHDPVLSISTNSLLPHVIARAARAAGSRMLQMSTDCVFSGRIGNYSEADLPDPVDLYGRSKLLGECDAPALTIRTSIVGRELGTANGLLEWFLAQRGRSAKGYARAFFSGVSTQRLASVIGDIIERHPYLTGVMHVAGERISKLELLGILNEAFDAGVAIERDDAVDIDRSLDASRFRAATNIAIPSWREMAREMAADAEPYETWRAA